MLNMKTHTTSNGTVFDAVDLAGFESNESTLVSVVVDMTGSTNRFADQILEMIKNIISGCKAAPKWEAFLIRVTVFNSLVGVKELHGFLPLKEIDGDAYPALVANGLTNLNNAVFDGVDAIAHIGGLLTAQYRSVNALLAVVTDGENNQFGRTEDEIATALRDAVTMEKVEGIVPFVVGINTSTYGALLADFCQKTGMKFVDAGECSPKKVAQIGGLIAQSAVATSKVAGGGDTNTVVIPGTF